MLKLEGTVFAFSRSQGEDRADGRPGSSASPRKQGCMQKGSYPEERGSSGM